ncbi:MAG: hypothetical protein QXP36_03515 [Conexivisphaerales archaeon]
MKILKLGIIGLGYVGQIHLQHAKRLDNARVIAVADLSKKALSKAKSYGVKKPSQTTPNCSKTLKSTQL